VNDIQHVETNDQSLLDTLITSVHDDFDVKIPADVKMTYTETEMKIEWDQFDIALNPSSGA
jgi:hypothetical protein